MLRRSPLRDASFNTFKQFRCDVVRILLALRNRVHRLNAVFKEVRGISVGGKSKQDKQ